MNYQEALEHAKTLAAQYRLGVRQQEAVAMMLDKGRWPVALPGTSGGEWICESSWSASLKMMRSLAAKQVVVATGDAYTYAGVEYPMYVLADMVTRNLPTTAKTLLAHENTRNNEPMTNPIAPQVTDALRSAANGYANALEAMRVDLSANIGALRKGKLRQLSNNAVELQVRFGEMTATLALASKVLPADQIRDIIEAATLEKR